MAEVFGLGQNHVHPGAVCTGQGGGSWQLPTEVTPEGPSYLPLLTTWPCKPNAVTIASILLCHFIALSIGPLVESQPLAWG